VPAHMRAPLLEFGLVHRWLTAGARRTCACGAAGAAASTCLRLLLPAATCAGAHCDAAGRWPAPAADGRRLLLAARACAGLSSAAAPHDLQRPTEERRRTEHRQKRRDKSDRGPSGEYRGQSAVSIPETEQNLNQAFQRALNSKFDQINSKNVKLQA
jgi:hypothetical protein